MNIMTTAAIRHILAPVDLSSCSRAALELAMTLGEALGASVDVLYVSPTEEGIGNAADELRQFVAGLPRTAAPLKERVASGDARERIVTIAEREKFDLIVIGTHGRTGRPRSLAGSVAESVVRTAASPVVTVREAS
jgi:nucleotide-binding universal stress UspA family protein